MILCFPSLTCYDPLPFSTNFRSDSHQPNSSYIATVFCRVHKASTKATAIIPRLWKVDRVLTTTFQTTHCLPLAFIYLIFIFKLDFKNKVRIRTRVLSQSMGSSRSCDSSYVGIVTEYSQDKTPASGSYHTQDFEG